MLQLKLMCVLFARKKPTWPLYQQHPAAAVVSELLLLKSHAGLAQKLNLVSFEHVLPSVMLTCTHFVCLPPPPPCVSAAMVSSHLELHKYATGRQARVVTAMTLLKSHLFR
jgi:hypothetical protein